MLKFTVNKKQSHFKIYSFDSRNIFKQKNRLWNGIKKTEK